MFAFPHGFTVDKQGNVWASDANKDEMVLGKSAKDSNGVTRGHQIFKLSSTGKVLMTLGKEGVAGNGPDTFDQPSGIAIAPNGDIFVTDGHGKNDRVVKFSKDGRFIKTWGHHGEGPGEFDQPHDISIGGSQNHVFVADRSNSRVQIFDQDGNFIAAWKQFGRPSAVYVAKDDTLYVSDSQSNSTVNPGYLGGHDWERQGRLAQGIHTGSRLGPSGRQPNFRGLRHCGGLQGHHLRGRRRSAQVEEIR